jgi:Nucleotidyl transferase AbiEii toxin, Type IV TA system
MIQNTSLQRDHLVKIIDKHQRLNPRLFEKTSRALKVLEAMVLSGKPFIFKGGTALMLLLKEPTRLSIDLDIIVEEDVSDLSDWIESFLPEGYRLERKPRVDTGIPKNHYKIHYDTVLDGEPVEDNILIDVLFEKNRYARVIDTPIHLGFLAMEGEPVVVRTPDLSSMLGDKLTAFGPRTVGVPYMRANETPSELEVLKQMHDVARIIERLDLEIDLQEVRTTYHNYVAKEAAYRGKNLTPADTLKDAYHTALCLISNGSLGDTEAITYLRKGKEGLSNYVFASSYSRRQCVIDATLVCWLTTALIMQEGAKVVWAHEVGQEQPVWQKHEKIMTGISYDAPSALPYWVAIKKMQNY